MTYLFSHADKTERERLAAIEAGLDPTTIECLEKIGVGEGWRCLEIGAGAGSIAEWLSRRVGPQGKVVATDLQTKFLEAIDASNLVVRKHDITKDELEPDAFDLVKVYRMTIERMRERMIKAGLFTNDEIDQFLADGQSPELHAITAIHCSAWGRKPW